MGDPLIGYVGGFEFHSDTYTTVTDEVVGNTSDASLNLAHSDVDGTAATIKVNGSKVGAQYYNLRPNGNLTLDAGISGDVTATYNYCNVVVAAGAFMSWSVDASTQLFDTTNFNTVGWTEQISGLNSWTGSAERHWQDDKVANQEGRKALVRFWLNDSNDSDYYVGWAIINGFNANVSVDALVDEGLEFTGVGSLYKGW